MPFSLPLDRTLLSPPGDTIQETLDAIGMTQAELAARMGRSKEKLNELIRGKAPLTMDTAIMLERVLGIPVHFWIKRESAYQETLARIEEKEQLQRDLSWLDLFPLKTLHKLGLVSESRKTVQVLQEMLQFFRFAKVKQWNEYYMETSSEVSFRISLKNTQNPGAIAVWLRMGEKSAEALQLLPYDEKKFRAALYQIRDIARHQPGTYLSDLQNITSSCGVALVYTPSLPKAKINGAARWLNQTPLIQISDLYKTNDQFWFSFFHEACHILEHGKKEVFLEKLEGADYNEKKEDEANTFAANWLIPSKPYTDWANSKAFISENMARQFADQIGVHPGVVVGRLQHDKILKPTYLNHLKVPVNFALDS
jgi:HTH-type transcriptional regulator / antitoxin HigA